MRVIAVVWGVLLSMPAAAEDAGPKKERVAMLAPRAAPGVEQATANLLGDVIAADVQRSPRHELMTAADVTAALSLERQKQLMGCSEDTGCLAEIGNALGADLLLDVSVGAVGNLRVVAMRLIETKTGRALRRESETVSGEAELVDASHRLSTKIFDLPELNRRRVPGFIVLGGAAVLAVVGLTFGIIANNNYQAFRASPFDDDLGHSAKRQAYIADGFYIGALVAAGIATFLLITGGSSSSGGR